jgi:hypothetical protein
MTASTFDTLAEAKARIASEKKATRAAQAALYAARLDALRDRYRDAFGQCADGERTACARHLFAAAAIFERDARHFPSRMRKAVAQMELAVFMLAGKVRP